MLCESTSIVSLKGVLPDIVYIWPHCNPLSQIKPLCGTPMKGVNGTGVQTREATRFHIYRHLIAGTFQDKQNFWQWITTYCNLLFNKTRPTWLKQCSEKKRVRRKASNPTVFLSRHLLNRTTERKTRQICETALPGMEDKVMQSDPFSGQPMTKNKKRSFKEDKPKLTSWLV